MKNNGRGFSLIETMITLTLFLIIFALTLKVSSFCKITFNKIKKKEENLEFTHSALEKIKIDVNKAGEFLREPIKSEKIKCIEIKNNTLKIIYGEEGSELKENSFSGSTKIYIKNSSKFKRKINILILENQSFEINRVLKQEGKSLILERPLASDYEKEKTKIIPIKEINYFLDEKTNILRRKVNNSSAQPLLEEINKFIVYYNEKNNLVNIQFLMGKNDFYELSVFPKNLALFKGVHK